MNIKISKFTVRFVQVFRVAMTLFLDRSALVPIARQLVAMNYPSTEGTILSSEVTQHDAPKARFITWRLATPMRLADMNIPETDTATTR
jgi:hypothetical protein